MEFCIAHFQNILCDQTFDYYPVQKKFSNYGLEIFEKALLKVHSSILKNFQNINDQTGYPPS